MAQRMIAVIKGVGPAHKNRARYHDAGNRERRTKHLWPATPDPIRREKEVRVTLISNTKVRDDRFADFFGNWL